MDFLINRFLFATLLLVIFSPVYTVQSNPLQPSEIKYCISPDWLPFEAIRDNKHVGLSKDYLDIISDALDIDFVLVATPTWIETIDALRGGRCNAIPFIEPTTYTKSFLSFSEPIFEAPNVLVTRVDEKPTPGLFAVGDRLIGVVRHFRYAEFVARYYEKLNIYFVDDDQHGLELLSKGDIDVMVTSLLRANTIISQENLTNVAVSGFAERNKTLSLAVTNDFQYILPQINKAIADISESKKVAIYKRWYTVTSNSHRNYLWFLSVCAFLAMFAVLVLWIRNSQAKINSSLDQREKEIEQLRKSLVNKNRTVEFLTTQDELTGLFNRNYMLQKVDEEMSRDISSQGRVTLLLIHIGGFNQLVQKNKQDLADKIISRVAAIILEKTREIDVVARWNDDEILMLCPQSTPVQVQIHAEHILTGVELQSLNLFKGIKVSVGSASLAEGDSFIDWLAKAQRTMRQAQKSAMHAYETADH